MPRFRIKTLLVFTAIVAVSIFLWLRYITPNVERVGIEGGNLVFHMTEAYSLNAFHLDPRDPFAPPIPGPAPAGSQRLASPYSLSTFVAFQIPLWMLGVLAVFVLGTTAGVWILAKWLFRRRMQRKTASPNA